MGEHRAPDDVITDLLYDARLKLAKAFTIDDAERVLSRYPTQVRRAIEADLTFCPAKPEDLVQSVAERHVELVSRTKLPMSTRGLSPGIIVGFVRDVLREWLDGAHTDYSAVLGGQFRFGHVRDDPRDGDVYEVVTAMGAEPRRFRIRVSAVEVAG